MSRKITVLPARSDREARESPVQSPSRHDPSRILSPENAERGSRDLPEGLSPEVAAVFKSGAAAWRPFIKAYSPFILACARRLASDYDERMEIYVHVCSRLFADDCRRIRQFRGVGENGRCKFTTWLAAVVLNLGREWIRTIRGRRRLYRKIRELPRNDRLIFRYRFWEGFGVSEIVSLLQLNHGIDFAEEQVVASLRQIRRLMGRDHVWRLVAKEFQRGRCVSLDGGSGRGAPGIVGEPRSEAPTPDVESRAVLAVDLLRRAVRLLPELEQQAVMMKFSRGMSARAIAGELGIRNYKRVYELQARAIVKIRGNLIGHGVSLDDFGPRPGALELLK